MDPIDFFTKFASRSLEIILTKYPTRTTLGVIVGGALYSFARIFQSFLNESTAIDFLSISIWSWMFIGLFLTHIPTLIHSFGQKLVGNEPIDTTIELIKQGNFTEPERRRHYRALITKVMESAEFTKEKKNEIKKFENIISNRIEAPEEPPVSE